MAEHIIIIKILALTAAEMLTLLKPVPTTEDVLVRDIEAGDDADHGQDDVHSLCVHLEADEDGGDDICVSAPHSTLATNIDTYILHTYLVTITDKYVYVGIRLKSLLFNLTL